MIKLTIGIAASRTGTDEASDQQILVSHFKCRSLTLEQAKDGFIFSPGVVIIMPRSGQECFSINGDRIVVTPGLVLLLNGEDNNVLVSNDTTMMWDDTQPGFGVIEMNAIINDSFRLRDCLRFPQYLNVRDSRKITDLYHDLTYGDHATRLHPDGKDISLHLAAAQIAGLILKSAVRPSTPQSDSTSDSQVTELRHYLLANLSEKVTTSDMARHLGLSRSHFCKVAKTLLGEAPVTYMRQLRLERSLELLDQTDDSIESIAADVGYGDRFSFSKEFKRHYGFSPVQYRKQSYDGLHSELHTKAQILFDQRHYQKAMSLCETALQKAGVDADQDQVVYLYGRCLVALGRTDEALAAWKRLKNQHYVWQAGMQRSRLYFRNNHYQNALVELEQLWLQAEDLQYGDIIQIWMEQVSALVTRRKAKPIRHYLAYRKAYFATDRQSTMIAVHAARGTGDCMAILEHCHDAKDVRFRALQSAGKYDQMLALYGSDVGQDAIARTLLNSGQYEQVLALVPGVPQYSVDALIQMGRAAEAIRRFPEDCSKAYLDLGQYETVLELSPEPCPQKIYALQALGRLKELKTIDVEGTWLWHLAQLYVRPAYLLEVDYPDTSMLIPYARILLALEEGNSPDEMIEHITAIPRIDSDDLWAQDYVSTPLLLRHVIPALVGSDTALQQDLRIMMEDWRFFDLQVLYYDAAYLLGDIDLDAWRQQPHQIDISARALFIQALSHDLGGRVKEACHCYSAFVKGSSPYGEDNVVRRQLAQWRLNTGL